MTCTAHQIFSGVPVKEDDIRGAYSMHARADKVRICEGKRLL